MLNLVGTGVICFFIGIVGYKSWHHPERQEPPTGYALGTIRASQTAIVVGLLLVIIGVIGSLIQRLS